MQAPVEVWRGCSGYWQPSFIRENFLALGHTAWQGYMTHGRGLVLCDVEVAGTESMDWARDVVRYRARYIPAVEMSEYFKAQGLQADDTNRLMGVVQAYCPEKELLIAIAAEGPIEVSWLRNLAIHPPDCYQQVCNRWEEFSLKSSADGSCGHAA